MGNARAAILVIGDEILSGRTRDSNMHFLAKALCEKGIDLCEARVVADDNAAIIAAVQDLAARYDHVFTSGGIGPTHDDITAEAVALAFGTTAHIRQDAYDLLDQHYKVIGKPFNEARQRMARIPPAARLIDNPVSIAPGFILENVYVMAGVPSVFEAMVASVLAELTTGAPLLSHTIRLELGEGDIADRLTALTQEFADVQFGSYPFATESGFLTRIVMRSRDAQRLEAAVAGTMSAFEGYINAGS